MGKELYERQVLTWPPDRCSDQERVAELSRLAEEGRTSSTGAPSTSQLLDKMMNNNQDVGVDKVKAKKVGAQVRFK